MTADYETLHSALIENGLLDISNEKLYPIERRLLTNFNKYRYLYYPKDNDIPKYGEASLNPMEDIYLRVQFERELEKTEKTCMVPAATAACALFRNDDHQVINTHIPAEKIRELGIWPVDMNTNASMAQTITPAPNNNPTR